MSRFKTILVHMAHDEGHMTRFNVALEMGREYDAHLIAVYNASPVSMPLAGRGYSLGYLNEATEIARERAATVREEVEEACAKHGVPVEWRMEEGDHLKVLAKHAQTCDLVIVNHAKADELEDRVTFHIPENIVLSVGCPVLVLPHPCPRENGFSDCNVMIAWKGTKESLRAVRDALPILQRARTVRLLVVSKPDLDTIPGAEIAASLARHDVSVEIVTDVDSGRNVADTILFHAGHSDADLIIMGAYGHSRLREIVAGSVTKDITAHMTVPIILSH